MFMRPIDFEDEPEEFYEDDYAPEVCDCERCGSALPLTA
jgi:hypothetical protein